jgi:hypothetical protein
MSAQKITVSEINERLIENLPTRPNAPTSMGGKGYSAKELKAAFDSLPRLIAERYNELIDDLTNPEGSEIINGVKTGPSETDTLGAFLESVKNGSFLENVMLDGEVLIYYLRSLRSELEALRSLIENERGNL